MAWYPRDEYLEFIGGMVSSEYDLCYRVSDSLAPLHELRVVVDLIQFGRTVHELLVPVVRIT